VTTLGFAVCCRLHCSALFPDRCLRGLLKEQQLQLLGDASGKGCLTPKVFVLPRHCFDEKVAAHSDLEAVQIS
jgi:hypothetical protein